MRGMLKASLWFRYVQYKAGSCMLYDAHKHTFLAPRTTPLPNLTTSLRHYDSSIRYIMLAMYLFISPSLYP